jgi:uncharacterized protein with PIN domain
MKDEAGLCAVIPHDQSDWISEIHDLSITATRNPIAVLQAALSALRDSELVVVKIADRDTGEVLYETSIVIDSRYGAEGLRNLDLFLATAGADIVAVDSDQTEEKGQRIGAGQPHKP